MTGPWLVFALAAYVFGSCPFGKLIGSAVANIDITRRGSGNIGATNVARELGIKWGILTLVLDASKGFLPVFIAVMTQPDAGAKAFALGVAALIGHQFSIFKRFTGGKGVATALGAYMGFSCEALIICGVALVIFVIIVWKWDYVSLGSIVAACSIPVLLLFLGVEWIVVGMSALVAMLICLKHRENIGRLLRHEERRWSKRKNQESSSSSLSSSSSE